MAAPLNRSGFGSPAPPALDTPAFLNASAAPLGLSFTLVLMYAWLVFGRFVDLLPIPHAAMMLAGPLLVSSLLSGNGRSFSSSRVCQLLCLFTGWMILGVPFAVWRGGSFKTIITTWASVMAWCFILACALTSVARCRKLMETFGLA